jgi:hypothetical protein
MKVLFGFTNTSDITRLSPALQARNINMLKAAPSDIDLKGLYQLAQPGYAQYASNIPAFIYATETKKRVPLNREGYPILTKPIDIIPLVLPSIYVSYKNKEIPASIKAVTTVKEITSKDKSIHAYTLEYAPGITQLLNTSGFEVGVYPIANTVSAEDLPHLINILRIASGFLRTHKYPAFSDQTTFEYEASIHDTEEEKRDLTHDEKDSAGGVAKKRMICVKEEGESTWVSAEPSMDEVEITLKYAKPTTDPSSSWGSPLRIPNTDGVVFPFVEELAKWDDRTVIDTIGRYFMRCLGHTTDGCLTSHSRMCIAWKKSIHKTMLGDQLSHLFKVISVAIPSQSRVFPVLVGRRYTGCYLSGSGYSLAIRGEIFRPVSYTKNQGDFDHFESTDAVLKRILGIVTDDVDDEWDDMKDQGVEESMRKLNKYLTNKWTVTADNLELIRVEASKIHYPQEYLRINMENIRLVLTWVRKGEVPDSMAMHSNGLGKPDILSSALSVFGPAVPSPEIPGAPKVQLSSKPPAKFSKTLVFRSTTLETAVADWVEMAKSGVTHNGPDRLNARYQYVTVKGEAERESWFNVLHQYSEWYKAKQKESLQNTNVEMDVGLADGGVAVELGVDMAGF